LLALPPYTANFGISLNLPTLPSRKFASYVFLEHALDRGVVVASLAPATLNVTDDASGAARGVVTTVTDYPFGDSAVVSAVVPGGAGAEALPLYVRIPGWAVGATVSVDGAPAAPAANGTLHKVQGRVVLAGCSCSVSLSTPTSESPCIR
jgi:hypothetical protein